MTRNESVRERANQLAENAEVVNIDLMEVAAKRLLDGQEVSMSMNSSEERVEILANAELTFTVPEEGGEFVLEVRLQFINLPQGSLEIAARVLYSAEGWSQERLVEDELLRAYYNQVGYLTILPFLHKEVLDISRSVLNGEIRMPAMRLNDPAIQI